ncbi:MAG: ATP-grasp domain-containing protein [bacterium]|nr:ATP-grasp domain-containing protein [bacterium]
MSAVVIGGDYQGLGIIRSLARENIPVYLLDFEPCIATSSLYVHKFSKCPPPEDEKAFIDFLIRFAEEEKLSNCLIYPTTDEMVRLLSVNRESLLPYYKISSPKWQITELLYNKKLTYNLAQKVGVPIPQTFYPSSIEELKKLNPEFPVIIKPAVKELFVKTTKKKAIPANNLNELVSAYETTSAIIKKEEIMVQEIIPDGPRNLYSFCSMFKNKTALATLVAKRIRQHPMVFGRATTYAETVDIPELEELGTKILSEADYYGLSEVEFIWDARDKKYKLLDINARTWGWHTLGNVVGINFPLVLYNDMMGLTQKSNKKMIDGKWMRLLTDLPVAMGEMIKGNLSSEDYVNSLTGTKDAVWDDNDPMPFLKEIFLLPYLLKKRGF